jgi:Cu2+-containing amine oxidase
MDRTARLIAASLLTAALGAATGCGSSPRAEAPAAAQEQRGRSGSHPLDPLTADEIARATIVDRDVVLWYTFAVTHLPRPEDWPVMPVHTAGFKLVPAGFFSENPAQ